MLFPFLYLFSMLYIVLAADEECSLCTLPNGECTFLNEKGVLCKECLYRGYVNPVDFQCVCNSRFDNPALSCNGTFAVKSNVTKNVYVSDFYCSCDRDWDSGFWKESTTPLTSRIYVNESDIKEFKYGLPYPAICNECYNKYYGPPPNTVTPSSLVDFRIQACNRLGGQDPLALISRKVVETDPDVGIGEEYDDFLFYPKQDGKRQLQTGLRASDDIAFVWFECSNHGTWNAEGRYCVCNTGWGLGALPELGHDDNILYSCIQCVGPYGPPIPSERYAVYSGSNVCSVPWTPDPVDGAFKECSGHGVFQQGVCMCYQNSTHGWWTLGTYSMYDKDIEGVGIDTYITVNKYFSVLTCINCLTGYAPDTYCLEKTDSPSISPSHVPTDVPTKAPTKTPTNAPTKDPTKSPTNDPTKNPSEAPTKSPSKVPTKSPSDVPTKSPSNVPTKSPTELPTHTPTKSPTKVPTKDPTNPPSHAPTKDPTDKPTIDPTRSPSHAPTRDPTNRPSKSPTRGPSHSPTTDPTKAPTEDPTRHPSHAPTVDPTKAPTGDPTRHPSHAPTVDPTKAPTKDPTKDPTNAPTKDPTRHPSHAPTKDPTEAPTKDPTKHPSHAPTIDPTKAPTKSPTESPTKRPTEPPSHTPTKDPTKEPSKTPTKSPSVSPTKPPSHVPTKDPTKNPTLSPSKTPTESPTSAPVLPSVIRMYWMKNTFGTIIDVDTMCPNLASSLGIPYRHAVPFLSRNSLNIQDFSSYYKFSKSSSILAMGTSTSIGTWQDAVLDPAPTRGLVMSIVAAGIKPSPAPTPFWTGFVLTGSPSNNCGDWASMAGTGVRGDASAINDIWIDDSTTACFAQLSVYCLIIQDTLAPTKSPTKAPTAVPTTATPTKSPTKAPTLTPTTKAPTKVPTKDPTKNPTVAPTKSPTKAPTASPTTTNVLFYASPGVAPSTSVVRGNLGTRTQTNAYCAQASIPPAPTPSCLTSPTVQVTKPPLCISGTEKAFLSYTGDEVVDTRRSDQRIYVARPTPTGHVYFDMKSNWEDLFSPTATPTETRRRLQTVKGSISTALGFCSYNIWTGSDVDGRIFSSNCVDFTSVGVGVLGGRGDMSAQGCRFTSSGSGATCSSGTSLGIHCTCDIYANVPSPSPTTFSPNTQTLSPVYNAAVLLYPGSTTAFSNLASRAKSTAMCTELAMQIEQAFPDFTKMCRNIKWFGGYSTSDDLYNTRTAGKGVFAFGSVDGAFATLNPGATTWDIGAGTPTLFSPTPTPKTVVSGSTFKAKWAVMNTDFQFITTVSNGVIFTGSNNDGSYRQTGPTPSPTLVCTNYCDFSVGGNGVRGGGYILGTTDYYSSIAPGCNTIGGFGCSCDWEYASDRDVTTLPPTITSGTIMLFSDNSISNRGDIAPTKTIMDKFCSILLYHLSIGSNYQPPLEDEFDSVALFVSILGDDINSYPTKYSFPTSAPVQSLSGVEIASSWSNFVGGTLTTSLYNAGVFEYNSPTTYWTNGVPVTSPTSGPTTCSQMNSASGSFTGIVGSITSTSSTALNSGTLICSTSTRMMCMAKKI